MKIANPERTLGSAMVEQGKRPNGWYEMETLVAAVRGMSPDFVQIDVLTVEETSRLRSELSQAEVYPWRYSVTRWPSGMVLVRALEQRSRVTETQPQRLGSRHWEADPDGYFGGGGGYVADGLVPGTGILAGSEHDPRLGSEPRWEDE